LRDWPAIDQTRTAGASQRLGRRRGLPFIRRSALLEETEPVVAPTIEDTVPINRIGTASIERDETVPIRYATSVPVRID
jgi:hypothetical protein